MTTKRCFNTAEAIAYLGIKRRSFESHILPRLQSKGIRIGTCIVFEVTDLDAAWESYKMTSGSERPGVKGETKWDAQRPLASTGRQPDTMSTGSTGRNAFDNAALKVLKRQKAG